MTNQEHKPSKYCRQSVSCHSRHTVSLHNGKTSLEKSNKSFLVGYYAGLGSNLLHVIVISYSNCEKLCNYITHQNNGNWNGTQ